MNTVTAENGNGQIMHFRLFAVRGGNVKFSVFIKIVSEVVLKVAQIDGSFVNFKSISFVDGKGFVFPVRNVDEAVAFQRLECGRGLVAVKQNRTGNFCPDRCIFQLPSDIDAFKIASGQDGQSVSVFEFGGTEAYGTERLLSRSAVFVTAFG